MKPRFIAMRKDGLGARLIPLLNAIAMAKLTGGTFEFAWPYIGDDDPHGELGSVEDIFSQDFLDQHHKPSWLDVFDHRGKEGSKRVQYFERVLTEDRVQDLLRSDVEGAADHIADLIDLRPICDLPDIYPGAFADIRFSATVRAAIDAAQDVPLEPATMALHLRAGDVIHGNARFFGHLATSKALSFPVGRLLADRPNPTLVFGQDPELINYVCQAPETRAVASLPQYKDMNALEAWFFETCLMARCDDIVGAADSAFSGVAALIGGKTLANGLDVVNSDDLLEFTLGRASQEPVSDLQKAHAFWYVFHRMPDLETQTRLTCLRKACAFDRQNGLYNLVLTSELMSARQPEEAVAVLADLIEMDVAEKKPRPGCFRRVLKTLRKPDASAPIRELRAGILPQIKDLMRLGYPEAALCQAMTATDPEDIRYAQNMLSGWRNSAFFEKPVAQWMKAQNADVE